jgi:hypothetical protein
MQVVVRAKKPIKATTLPFPRLGTQDLSKHSFEVGREITDRRLSIFDGRNNQMNVIGHDHSSEDMPFAQLRDGHFDGFERF